MIAAKGGSSTGAPGVRPLFEICKGFNFENFDCRTRINFIVIKMQCLQCVFYSLLSLQKHRVCVKGHLQTRAGTPPPPVLKFLDPPLIAATLCFFFWGGGGYDWLNHIAKFQDC